MTDDKAYIVTWSKAFEPGFAVSRIEASRLDEDTPEAAAQKAVEEYGFPNEVEENAEGIEVGVAEERLRRHDVEL